MSRTNSTRSPPNDDQNTYCLKCYENLSDEKKKEGARKSGIRSFYEDKKFKERFDDIEGKLRMYLEQTPSNVQTVDAVRKTLLAIARFESKTIACENNRLHTMEKVQLINLRTNTRIMVENVVERANERFTVEQLDTLAAIVQDNLPAFKYPDEHQDEDEESEEDDEDDEDEDGVKTEPIKAN